MKRWIEKAVVVSAVAYPALLLLAVVLMRWLGERWWVTGVLLFLPRVAFALPLPVLVGALVFYRERRLLLTQALAALLILFPLMGLVLPFPTFADSAAPRLRVLSYNINSDFGGSDHVFDAILRLSPDLVLLQEVPANDEALIKRLQDAFPSVRSSTQFITASKFPITSYEEPDKLPFHTAERSPRFVHFSLESSLGKLAVYNVHPLSPRGGLAGLRGSGLRREILSGRLFRGDSADSLQAHTELRDLQVTTFAELASKETDPVVIAGDTNLPGLSPALGRLSAYRDGFRAASWGFGYTFPADRFFRWMRLDRIMAGPELKFVHFDVCPPGPSDHDCVIAELQRSH